MIIFNYDRCIEQYLCCALQQHYRLAEPEASELVKNINIFHPYGSVGTLPWIDPNGAVKFGSEPGTEQLIHLVKQIKTYTEGTDPKSSRRDDIRERMCNANKLIFLGFAFHTLNMELMQPEAIDIKESGSKELDCFATTYKISKSDQEVIKIQIHALYSGLRSINMRKADLECSNFFQEFWRSLAF